MKLCTMLFERDITINNEYEAVFLVDTDCFNIWLCALNSLFIWLRVNNKSLTKHITHAEEKILLAHRVFSTLTCNQLHIYVPTRILKVLTARTASHESYEVLYGVRYIGVKLINAMSDWINRVLSYQVMWMNGKKVASYFLCNLLCLTFQLGVVTQFVTLQPTPTKSIKLESRRRSILLFLFHKKFLILT